MTKAVFDTNIFISALLFPGSVPEKIYLLAIDRKIELCISPAIMVELADKLRSKFGANEDEIARTLKQLARISTVVRPDKRLRIIEDDPDNRILECALEAKTDFIVSGDKHLLRLKSYQGIPIVKASRFFRFHAQ